MQVSTFIFHQGKQQHTLVLGQASNQVVTSLRSKVKVKKPYPQNHKKCVFYVSVY